MLGTKDGKSLGISEFIMVGAILGANEDVAEGEAVIAGGVVGTSHSLSNG